MRFEKISGSQFLTDFLDYDVNYNDIILPKRATRGSAGYDIYSPINFELKPMQTIKIPTGIKVKLDTDKCLMVFPRSGQGFKYKVQLYNTVGIIDSDYYNNIKNDGHIWVKLYNDSPEGETLVVKAGDAVCQGVILPYFCVEDDATDAERTGGFGSTSNNSSDDSQLKFEGF